MGINQDIQFDTILIKERNISVDYVHEFDGGSFQIYIPKVKPYICIFEYSILETIFLNVTFVVHLYVPVIAPYICVSQCSIH